jgi:hypothetical protein
LTFLLATRALADGFVAAIVAFAPKFGRHVAWPGELFRVCLPCNHAATNFACGSGDNMNAKPSFAHASSFSITVVAALAAFVAIGLLTGVAFLFQRNGSPLEQLAAAEHACTQHVYVSEREACMREWLDAARARNVASK